MSHLSYRIISTFLKALIQKAYHNRPKRKTVMNKLQA